MGKKRGFAVILAAGILALASSGARAETVYGVTQAGFLVNWDSATPGTIPAGVAIQGLSTNETIIGIDFRPATGELFGLGSFSRLYTINTATGMSTPVGAAFGPPPLNGASFGFDFNPTVDRIRLVSDSDQNLRLNPNTGQIGAVDPNLIYAAGDPNFGTNPNVSHVAYTNSVAGATSTTLYGLDTGTDTLVRHTVGPGFNELVTVGLLGTNVTEIGGFDISGGTGIAYATVRDVQLSQSTFWTINLTTGAGAFVGQIGGGHVITSMAVVPEPGTLSLLVLAGTCLIRRTRR